MKMERKRFIIIKCINELLFCDCYLIGHWPIYVKLDCVAYVSDSLLRLLIPFENIEMFLWFNITDI